MRNKILLGIFIFILFIFLHKFFSGNLSTFSTEILAAAIGAIVTVAAMAFLLQYQVGKEKEKEHSTKVFEKKLDIYQNLLDFIFKMDDDNILEKKEIQEVENLAGVACLVAGDELVLEISQFIWQLKAYGCMYPRNMDKNQIKHFVDYLKEEWKEILEEEKEEINESNFQDSFITLDDLVDAMRKDLAVVEGDIIDDIEHFLAIKYDEFKLIRDPNKVE